MDHVSLDTTTECHICFNKDNFIYSVRIDPISRRSLIACDAIHAMQFPLRCIFWSWCKLFTTAMIDNAMAGDALFIRRIQILRPEGYVGVRSRMSCASIVLFCSDSEHFIHVFTASFLTRRFICIRVSKPELVVFAQNFGLMNSWQAQSIVAWCVSTVHPRAAFPATCCRSVEHSKLLQSLYPACHT